MKKKLLSIILAASMALSSGTFAFAADVTRGDAVEKIIKAADDYNPGVQKSDIIIGYGDGKLHEEDKATLAQVLIMIKNGFGNLPGLSDYTSTLVFPEDSLTDAPSWAEEIIKEPAALGIAEGNLSRYVSEEDLDLMIQRVFTLYGTNPRDDFYTYINKETLESLQPIPGYTGSGTFYSVAAASEKAVEDIIYEVCAGSFEKGTKEQKIVDLYKTAMNVDAADEIGTEPIKEYLDAIDAAANIKDLEEVQGILYKDLTVNRFANINYTVDDYDNSRFMPALYIPGASFPQEYYGEGSPVMDVYKNYIVKLLMFCGESEEDAAADADLIIAAETFFANNSMSLEELAVASNTRNYFTVDEIKAMLPNTDVDKLIALCGYKITDSIMVMDPKAAEAFGSFFCDDNLAALKAMAKFDLIESYGICFGNTYVDVHNEYIGALYGEEVCPSYEQHVVVFLKTKIYDYLSQLYCEKNFSQKAKDDITAMVKDIIAEYKKSVETLTWMSEETKQHAITKLDKLGIKVGGPDTWDDDLADVDIKSVEEGGTFFCNTVEISRALLKADVAMYEAGPSRDLWAAPPFTANAFYNPPLNDINLLAGILQKPIYDESAPYEVNLGKIGYIIAHEITHALDNNGAEYDEFGNVNNWWTEDDYAAFEALCEDMVAFYDGKEPAFGIKTNGRLCLAENVADNGAIQCITSIAANRGADMDLLFRSVAELWTSKFSRTAAEYNTQIDTHAPDKLRCICPLQNVDEFYTLYNIQEGDAMYVAPEDRVRIW